MGSYAIIERRIVEGQGFAGPVVGVLPLWRSSVRSVKDGWCTGLSALVLPLRLFDHRDGRRGIGNAACLRSRTFRLRLAPFNHVASSAVLEAKRRLAPQCRHY